MRKLIAVAFSCLLLNTMAHGDTTCQAQAAAKKLSGTAKDSFVKKCQKDAKTACEAQAAEEKLAGAAKNRFLKKCEQDATAGT